MLIVDLIVGASIAAIVAWGVWAGAGVVLPIAGFAAGALLGALLTPLALDGGQSSDFALVFALPGALLAGALVAAVVERKTVRLRRRLARLDRHRTARTVGGGLLGLWIGLVAAWLAGAALVQVGSLRDRVEDSTIVGTLGSVLDPPGRMSESVDAPLDVFPIVAGAGPLIEPVNPVVVGDPDVRRADRSVVQISVSTCGAAALGSGWVAANGIVVTNAHVVYAASMLAVTLRGRGRAHPATPVWYDERNDLALLRVPALTGVRPLSLVPVPRPGTAGATIGFPLGQHAITAARIGRTTALLRGRVANVRGERDRPQTMSGHLITPFRGRSIPGNSGGPVVDTSGRVLTTVWGGRRDRASGMGVPNRFVSAALRRAGPAVETGKCRRAPTDRIG